MQKEATTHLSRVEQLITDAFVMLELAHSGDDSSQSERCARASIIHSSFVVESLANNCLRSLPLPTSLFNSLEQMPTLGKLEYYLWQIRRGATLDKGRKEVQAISELISLRNAYVHPKLRKMNEEMWTQLGIPKNADNWNASHAENVFRKAADFMKTYLVELCDLDYRQITWLVTSYVKTVEGGHVHMVRKADKEALEKIGKFLKSDLIFLGRKPKAGAV